MEKLSVAGVGVEKVNRGLDHGVWAAFMVAFDPKKNPLNVSIVQVSLYDNENVDEHFRVGKALEGLRDEGIVIVGAGMAVHSLTDFSSRLEQARQCRNYAFSFDDVLKEATCAQPDERQARMLALMKRTDARKAHPSLERLLPVYVCAGAARSDVGKRLWTYPEGSLS